MSNLFRGNGRVILARDYGYKPLFNNGVSLTTGFCDVDRRRVVVQYPRCSLRSPPLHLYVFEGGSSRWGETGRVWWSELMDRILGNFVRMQDNKKVAIKFPSSLCSNF